MTAKFSALEQTHSLRLRAKFRLNRFILSPSGGENPQFLPFFGLWHLVVSPIGGNLPLSNGIRIVCVLQRFHGEIACTNSDIQKRDEQTDKQKTRAPPNLAW